MDCGFNDLNEGGNAIDIDGSKEESVAYDFVRERREKRELKRKKSAMKRTKGILHK
jgi:hypothetical protein